jgi:DNA (cytosine-5)-methyltransferase 1
VIRLVWTSGRIETDGEGEVKITSKPEYRVPTMASVNASQTHGLTVASMFAGGGGSCAGYKMAGFDVVWANEFVPSAQETYRANHPTTFLDTRDVKLVSPADVLAATGLAVGELDVLDGSPPCQAFSTAGKREKGWAVNGGKGKRYEGGAVQHNEMLFFEYTRLLKSLQPRAFVAENVKGLTVGLARRMMGDEQLDAFESQDNTILHALMDCGYRVRWRVLDAKDYGVPQTRNRVIFLGVRLDVADRLGLEHLPFPVPLGYHYTVRDACPWIGQARVGGHRGFNKHRCENSADESAPPVMSVPMCVEMIVGNDKFKPKWGGLDGPSPAILAGGPHGGSGEVRIVQRQGGAFNREFGPDNPCPAVCAGQASQFVVYEAGRRVCDGTQEFGSAGEAATADRPSPPVLTPSNSVVCREERRKFTIAEVKRICSFPDDYVLTGSYARQWERLGNSVPPVMMSYIASALRDGVFARLAPLVWRPRRAAVIAASAAASAPVKQPERRRPRTSAECGKMDPKWAAWRPS